MSRPTHTHIDTAALTHNLQVVQRLAPRSRILAMVKSNAYGHGLAEAAQALSKAHALGVAHPQRALALRALGIQQDIVLTTGFFDPSELAQLSQQHIQLVIHHWPQIQALEEATLPNPVTVWIKLDSGMHRVGFSPEDFLAAWQRLQQCPNVQDLPILMSHFANADTPQDGKTQRQLQCFNEVTANLPGLRSLANSAAILNCPASHLDWVRPGLILYGQSPLTPEEDSQLKPVMHFTSAITAIRPLQAGDTIGYTSRYTCPEDMLVGIVPVGYGDGYPCSAPDGTPVLLNGQRVPLVGKISMDMLTLDLRSQPQAQLGDPVTLWGPGLPVGQVAKHAGTIPFELLCRNLPRGLYRDKY